MKAHSASKVLAVFSFLAVLTGFAGGASADFKIRIDCHGDNGLPTWAATSDTISVGVRKGNAWINVGNVSSPISCSTEDSIILTKVGMDISEISEVKITTSGDDTFWIDRMSLLIGVNQVVKTWGTDNNVGYCVSTDSADGASSNCYQTTAQSPYVFVI